MGRILLCLKFRSPLASENADAVWDDSAGCAAWGGGAGGPHRARTEAGHMNFLGAAITAALLLWGTAGVRAAEPIPTPAPLHDVSPIPAGPAGPAYNAGGGGGCGNCCGSAAGCCNGGHSGKLLAWLTYRPHRTRCGECNTCCGGCLPPLYLYFLGSCQEHNCASCGCGHNCAGHTCH
jgi:hypothetical protein